jgi:hypothetical protein
MIPFYLEKKPESQSDADRTLQKVSDQASKNVPVVKLPVASEETPVKLGEAGKAAKSL